MENQNCHATEFSSNSNSSLNTQIDNSHVYPLQSDPPATVPSPSATPQSTYPQPRLTRAIRSREAEIELTRQWNGFLKRMFFERVPGVSEPFTRQSSAADRQLIRPLCMHCTCSDKGRSSSVCQASDSEEQPLPASPAPSHPAQATTPITAKAKLQAGDIDGNASDQHSATSHPGEVASLKHIFDQHAATGQCTSSKPRLVERDDSQVRCIGQSSDAALPPRHISDEGQQKRVVQRDRDPLRGRMSNEHDPLDQDVPKKEERTKSGCTRGHKRKRSVVEDPDTPPSSTIHKKQKPLAAIVPSPSALQKLLSDPALRKYRPIRPVPEKKARLVKSREQRTSTPARVPRRATGVGENAPSIAKMVLQDTIVALKDPWKIEANIPAPPKDLPNQHPGPSVVVNGGNVFANQPPQAVAVPMTLQFPAQNMEDSSLRFALGF
ncbi:hypothetical protein CVT26_012424 [Gymnopilus dilepis]|uniref:Uncharacterized protein n=1 Tax=Gymnopilus dilepis TaxID=231916 RepID=A0A409YD17_9AGAR|nr:hypothetical protein CVT26_012424 [Gymnopilus dilepis]